MYKKVSKYHNRPKKPKKPQVVEPEFIRLNRYIAKSGICSRRQADEYIQKGLVTVNDKVVTEMGVKVGKNDVIKYKGKRLVGEKSVYYIMNKPKNYITSAKDPQGRPTVMMLFKDNIKERIYPVGRLDRNTTGILLFTNDGNLTKKLTHPKSKVSKTYVVTLDKPVTKNEIITISEGIELEDGKILPDAVYYFNNNSKDKIVIELHSGKNRIVRRIFESLNFEVKTLDRIDFAGLTKKDLKRGQWRQLEIKEIGFLKMKAGMVNNKKI